MIGKAVTWAPNPKWIVTCPSSVTPKHPLLASADLGCFSATCLWGNLAILISYFGYRHEINLDLLAGRTFDKPFR